MDDKTFFYKLLRLHPTWMITQVVLNEAEQRVDLYLDHEKDVQVRYPECDQFYGVYDHSPERIYRHLDTCQMATYIHVRPPRVNCPNHVPYEIANALVAVKKKGRISDREALRAFDMSQRIPVRLLPVRIYDALKIAVKFNIYAYDAFYLQCCLETKLPLVSLDTRMCEVAKSLAIKVVI